MKKDKYIIIDRYSNEKEQTIGMFYLLDEETQSVMKKWHSMELPWLDNQQNISCIPTGNYKAVIHYSPTFGKCLWIKDVEGRSEILIHAANFYFDLLGCIGIGKDLVDIDGDSYIDVTSSRDSLTELMELLDNQTVVDIDIV
jgi:hypothetical protein